MPEMRHTVSLLGDYLRGDLYNRVTGEETDEFLRELCAEARASRCVRLLICVHTSRAIFRVERFSLFERLEELAAVPGHRIALVADDFEVRLAHQYIATLARVRGLTVQSWPTEEGAIAWLRA